MNIRKHFRSLFLPGIRQVSIGSSVAAVFLFTCSAYSQTQSSGSLPSTLESALRLGYYELAIRQPVEIQQALDAGRVLSAEDISRFLERNKLEILKDLDVEVLHDFKYLPVVLVKPPTLETRRAALAHRNVEALRPPIPISTMISAIESSEQIGAGSMRNLGFNGAGTSVLVTDEGFDTTNIHPDFGMCSSVGTPSNTCRLATYQGRVGSSPSHGSNVSAIVATTASEAKIHHYSMETASGGISTAFAMQGLDWAIGQRDVYNIVAHNMSWGCANICTSCQYPWVSSGTVAGIAQIASAGNDFSQTALNSPANCPGVISVGRVNTQQANPENWSVAFSSNVSPSLDLLAPGGDIEAGGIDMSGTSQASPHVTGAVAILQAPDQWNRLSPESIESVMKWVGTPFLDTRVNLSFPFVDVYRSRMMSINIINPDGIPYQLSPAAPKTCGQSCYNYPQLTITATYPEGYKITGCGRISSTSCILTPNTSSSHRLLSVAALRGIAGIVLSGRGDSAFKDGFENNAN